MKKIVSLFTVCFIAVLSVSCAGFLDEKPTTQLSEATVFSTEVALEAEMAGVSEILHAYGNYVKGACYRYWFQASGLATSSNGVTASCRNFTYGSGEDTGNYQPFCNAFASIERCNRIITNLPKSPVDQAYKNEIDGEARFMRAFHYFLLAGCWGDVPIYERSVTGIDDVYRERDAWWRVYIQIIKDLEFAEENMRTIARQEQINFEMNRPAKGAATTLKAYTYVTIGSLLAHPDDNFWDSSKDAELIAAGKDPRTPDFSSIGINSAKDAFQLALEAAKKVLDSGDYSLCPDFRKLYRFKEHDEFFLPEYILEFPSNPACGVHHRFTYSAPEYYYKEARQKNGPRMRPGRFFIQQILKYSGGETYPESSQYKNIYYQTEDPRYHASFCDYYMQKGTTEMKTYPLDPAGSNNNKLAPHFMKAHVEGGQDYAGLHALKLSDVYLVAAEACANLSSSKGDAYWNDALAYLNVLRTRARKSHDAGEPDKTQPADYTAASFNSKDELITAVFWERMIELNFECGKEFLDDHRMGATWLRDNISIPGNEFFSDPCHAAYLSGKVKGSEPGKVYETDIFMLRKGLRLSYPATELIENQKARQNDFYLE